MLRLVVYATKNETGPISAPTHGFVHLVTDKVVNARKLACVGGRVGCNPQILVVVRDLKGIRQNESHDQEVLDNGDAGGNAMKIGRKDKNEEAINAKVFEATLVRR